MKKTTRSILQELSSLSLSKNKDLLIENRGSNLIESAINLLTLIHETYSPEVAFELEKRFINSIRSSDVNKFKRGIKKVQDAPDSDK